MFRTPHSVLAAPYNVDGNKDAYDFFNSRDERKAVEVMLGRKGFVPTHGFTSREFVIVVDGEQH